MREKQFSLVEHIGVPAMYEQLAEECVELSKAALKLARMIRDENHVWGYTKPDLIRSIEEEAADVSICLDQLYLSGLLNRDEFMKQVDFKNARMKWRLANND